MQPALEHYSYPMADLSVPLLSLARFLKSSRLQEPCQSFSSENPRWEDSDGRYLIARLSPLEDVASSTGHLFLHRLLRSVLGKTVFIDFAFLPPKSDRKKLSAAGVPLLFGALGRHGPEDYDAILVSCSYALELVNLPYLLLRSGLPLRASERRSANDDGRFWPSIILGGSNALASQSLIFPDGDSFVDGIYFGEGEEDGRVLVRALARSAGLPPAERAQRMEEATEAFWAAGAPPGSGRRVRVARCRPGIGDPLLADRYPLLNTEEARTARVQLSWGCPSFCAFCFEGYEHKPYRELSRERVLESARELARNTGASTLELHSFNFNSHTDILELMLELNRIFERVNMMSQRADLLLTVPGMLPAELLAEKSGFTLGIEGISEGMRAYYSKGLPSVVLARLLERLTRERVRELKLFYILSGTENESDIAEFSSFCDFLEGLRTSQDAGLRVLFSFGYLVRMPFTPLRGERLCLDRSLLESLSRRLKAIVEGSGFEFRLAADWEEYLTDQYLVLGPYELAEALESSAKAGCVYDRTLQGNLRIGLEKALRAAGGLDRQDTPSGPFLEEKGPDYPYALSFLETAVSPDFLERMRTEARGRRDGGSCMKGLGGEPDANRRCLGCGACSDPSDRECLLNHKIRPLDFRGAEELGTLIKAKRRMRPRLLRARLPEGLSGATEEFLGAWLLKEVLSRRGDLVGRLFRAEEALWNSPAWRERMGSGISGECVLALYGLDGTPESAPLLSDADVSASAEALSEALGSEVRPLDSGENAEVRSVTAVVTLNRNEDPQELHKRLRAFLADLRLNAVERKTVGGRIFEIAPKDRKKRILTRLELLLPEETDARPLPRLILEGAGKLDIGPLFRRPEDRALARIFVEKLELG